MYVIVYIFFFTLNTDFFLQIFHIYMYIECIAAVLIPFASFYTMDNLIFRVSPIFIVVCASFVDVESYVFSIYFLCAC